MPPPTTALVADFQTSSVTPVALPALAPRATVTLGANPTGIAAPRARPVAWVSAGDGITPFAPSAAMVGNAVPIGTPAECVAAAPKGHAWVCSGDGALVEVDPMTRDGWSGRWHLGGFPAAAVVSRRGSVLGRS